MSEPSKVSGNVHSIKGKRPRPFDGRIASCLYVLTLMVLNRASVSCTPLSGQFEQHADVLMQRPHQSSRMAVSARTVSLQQRYSATLLLAFLPGTGWYIRFVHTMLLGGILFRHGLLVILARNILFSSQQKSTALLCLSHLLRCHQRPVRYCSRFSSRVSPVNDAFCGASSTSKRESFPVFSYLACVCFVQARSSSRSATSPAATTGRSPARRSMPRVTQSTRRRRPRAVSLSLFAHTLDIAKLEARYCVVCSMAWELDSVL